VTGRVTPVAGRAMEVPGRTTASMESIMTTSIPPSPRRTRRIVLIVGVAAVVVAIGVAGFVAGQRHRPAHRAGPSGRPIDTVGKLTTPASGQTIADSARAGAPAGLPCDPPAGYDDVPGGQVTFTDETGRVLAAAPLDMGVTEQPAGGGFPRCAFTFRADVQAGHRLYGVEVGQRGKVTFTARQLAASELEMSLG
jgi:hypothetical protein